MSRALVAECFGTFCLVFSGTGAIVVNDVSGGEVTHVGIACTFGLVVMTLIYAFADVSGAHFNPAVTLGLWSARRCAGREVVPYITAQILGALLASLLLRSLFPAHATLGATLPSGSAMQSLLLEVVLTGMLMVVILRVSKHPDTSRLVAAPAVGAVICLEAMFAGPVSGASMNPARSLAPALCSGLVGPLWLYFVGPVVGALVGVLLDRLLEPPSVREPDPGAP